MCRFQIKKTNKEILIQLTVQGLSEYLSESAEGGTDGDNRSAMGRPAGQRLL